MDVCDECCYPFILFRCVFISYPSVFLPSFPLLNIIFRLPFPFSISFRSFYHRDDDDPIRYIKAQHEKRAIFSSFSLWLKQLSQNGRKGRQTDGWSSGGKETKGEPQRKKVQKLNFHNLKFGRTKKNGAHHEWLEVRRLQNSHCALLLSSSENFLFFSFEINCIHME